MKRLLKYILILLALLVIFVVSVDMYVTYSVKKQVYNDIQTIGHRKVGLLLGTSKYVAGGRVNLYYKYRIEAAVALYKAGKIDFVLVSGDNRRHNYNEPWTMKKDLEAAGIPPGRIILDYAGFRTLDSIVRSSAVFNAGSIIVISQRFHNERALFIANSKGLNAIASNAQDPPQRLQVKVMIREKLARVKMLLDLVFNKQPKFYGDTVMIEDTTNKYVEENMLFSSGPTRDALFCSEDSIIGTDCGIGELYITTKGDALYNISCIGYDTTKYYLGRYYLTDSNLVCTFHQTYTFYSGCGECPPELFEMPDLNAGTLDSIQLEKRILKKINCSKYPYAIPATAEELKQQQTDPYGDIIYRGEVFEHIKNDTTFLTYISKIKWLKQFHSDDIQH